MNQKVKFTANFQMKLFSLLLATLIWLFVTLESRDEIEIPLAVSYLNTPSGLVVKANHGPGFMIRIEGERILLLRQKLKGASAHLDLAGAGEGRVIIPGIENSVKLIEGVKPVRQSPLRAELTLVRKQ